MYEPLSSTQIVQSASTTKCNKSESIMFVSSLSYDPGSSYKVRKSSDFTILTGTGVVSVFFHIYETAACPTSM